MPFNLLITTYNLYLIFTDTTRKIEFRSGPIFVFLKNLKKSILNRAKKKKKI